MKPTIAHRFDVDRGQDGTESEMVGDALDHLIGTWTQEEADAFDTAVAELLPRE